MKKFVKNLFEDDILGMTAQVSFYLMFAIFPFLLFLITLLGMFSLRVGFSELSLVLPGVVLGLLEHLPEISGGAGVLTISLAVSLWSASNGVGALMKGIHYTVNRKPLKKTLRTMLLTIAFTFGYVLAIAAPFALSAAVSPLIGRLGAAGIIYLFITPLYIFAPGCKSIRKYAWAGAAVTTALWWLVNFAFGLLAGRLFSGNPLYGGVGAFLSAMLWIYAISFCIFLGSEINAHRSGLRK